MISAIAARKAAQAVQPLQEKVPPRPTPSIPPPSIPPPSPKRKSYSQHVKRASKKQKRDVRHEIHALPSPSPLSTVSQNPEDVIIIDSEDDEPTPTQPILSEESDVEILSAPPSHLAQRAWSPSLPLHDSSSDEDSPGIIDLPSRFSALPTPNIGIVLSNFHPVPGQNTFFLSAGDVQKLGLTRTDAAKGTLVVLTPRDTLCLLGTCRLSLLKGSIRVNAVPLHPSTVAHSIFAPRSSPLPVVECSGDATPEVAIDVSCLPRSLQSLCRSQSALVLLQELKSNVEALGRVCPVFEDIYEPSAWTDGSMSSPLKLDGLFLVNKQTRDVAPFVLPPTWNTSLVNLSPSPISTSSIPVFLVKGPKKCGKSTFARTLLNTLLFYYRRVAYLDCDPGQSEFTPGGQVSLNVVTERLFGPPYTHPSLPFRAHFIGATTPRASPGAYLDAIRDLIDVWKVDVMQPSELNDGGGDNRVTDTIPLIVNTMGWSKGLGADLMQKIEEMAEPSQIFDFAIDDASYPDIPHLSSQPEDHSTTKTHTLESAPASVLSTNFTAADHRNLSILSHFHALLPSRAPGHDLDQLTAEAWDVSLPLCAVPPYEVDVRAAFDQIVLTGAGSEDVVPEELDKVLNGALVGFVGSDHPYQSQNSSTSKNSRNSSSQIPYIQHQPLPPPSESKCIGIGLIRAVSFPSPNTPHTSAILHILTPTPLGLLADARILVKGEMELPIWGMLDFREFENGDTGGVAGVEKGKVPYLQWGRGLEGAIGAERRRFRRNLMRRGQV
ncbi:Polynucleotide 5'-hydroxyl-kinase GRC3 [Leucoagaricus sp. SymC.cos]|nr:Polynucleotide 5'-hydroxyl-kinase GRC3 [Leucoagaricus sp. SymC.cos]